MSRDTRKTLAGERARFLAVPTFLDNAPTSVIKVMFPRRREVTPTSTSPLRSSFTANAPVDRLSLINCQVRFESYLSRWKRVYRRNSTRRLFARAHASIPLRNRAKKQRDPWLKRSKDRARVPSARSNGKRPSETKDEMALVFGRDSEAERDKGARLAESPRKISSSFSRVFAENEPTRLSWNMISSA